MVVLAILVSFVLDLTFHEVTYVIGLRQCNYQCTFVFVEL